MHNSESVQEKETQKPLWDFEIQCINLYFLFQVEKLYCEMNYHDQKIRRTLTHDTGKHWTAVSTLLGLISRTYRDSG